MRYVSTLYGRYALSIVRGEREGHVHTMQVDETAVNLAAISGS